MKTIKGSTESIQQLYNSLNLFYGYPNLSTLTNEYSSIVLEYLTNIPCIIVNDCDEDLALAIEGLSISEGDTIAREPIEDLFTQEQPLQP